MVNSSLDVLCRCLRFSKMAAITRFPKSQLLLHLDTPFQFLLLCFHGQRFTQCYLGGYKCPIKLPLLNLIFWFSFFHLQTSLLKNSFQLQNDCYQFSGDIALYSFFVFNELYQSNAIMFLGYNAFRGLIREVSRLTSAYSIGIHTWSFGDQLFQLGY